MALFQILLVVATVGCGLAAGLLFAFAVVIMPGLSRLDDHSYLKAFRAIDGVIQDGQPLFMAVFVGAAVLLIIASVAGLWQLAGADFWLLIAAAVLYIVGVILPTGTINVPMNNRVKALDIESMDTGRLKDARRDFEPRWNRWNDIRTVSSVASTSLLVVLLLRL